MFHKVKIFTVFPAESPGEGGKFYYINSEGKKLQGKAKFYATSAAGSVAERGAEASAVVASLAGGVKEPVAEVEEVAEGVISDTMLGAYFSAYLKNPSISDRGRAGEDPILAQSTSSPCDWERAIAPSTPRFTKVRFKAST
jgi:hypothetical protein